MSWFSWLAGLRSLWASWLLLRIDYTILCSTDLLLGTPDLFTIPFCSLLTTLPECNDLSLAIGETIDSRLGKTEICRGDSAEIGAVKMCWWG